MLNNVLSICISLETIAIATDHHSNRLFIHLRHMGTFASFPGHCHPSFCHLQFNICFVFGRRACSPVPRPHLLARKNGLVSQVKFLGLAPALVSVKPSNIQNILYRTCSKNECPGTQIERQPIRYLIGPYQI